MALWGKFHRGLICRKPASETKSPSIYHNVSHWCKRRQVECMIKAWSAHIAWLEWTNELDTFFSLPFLAGVVVPRNLKFLGCTGVISMLYDSILPIWLAKIPFPVYHYKTCRTRILQLIPSSSEFRAVPEIIRGGRHFLVLWGEGVLLTTCPRGGGGR